MSGLRVHPDKRIRIPRGGTQAAVLYTKYNLLAERQWAANFGNHWHRREAFNWGVPVCVVGDIRVTWGILPNSTH